MIDIQKIVAQAEIELQDTDMFVVGCTCSPANDVELLIDSDTKVGIDACATLSRAIDACFDREVEDFSLTIASAGIGSELKNPRQFARLIGSSVEVLLLSGIKVIAQLEGADAQGLTLSYEEKQIVDGKKKKQLVSVSRRYEFDQIKYTKEWLDFK